MKSLRNFAMKEESGGKVEWPCRKMNVMCWREPWREAQSRRVIDDDPFEMKRSSFDRSFRRFFLGNDTLQCSRSQRKPTYLTVKAKSWPFLSMGCHGMPRGSVMQNTDSRSKS